jgi:hypothetical protein
LARFALRQPVEGGVMGIASLAGHVMVLLRLQLAGMMRCCWLG